MICYGCMQVSVDYRAIESTITNQLTKGIFWELLDLTTGNGGKTDVTNQKLAEEFNVDPVNISLHIKKLKEHGLIDVSYQGNRRTIVVK